MVAIEQSETEYEITVDRALARATSWLDLAGQYEMTTLADVADRGIMVSACADVADTWVKLAELKLRLQDAGKSLHVDGECDDI